MSLYKLIIIFHIKSLAIYICISSSNGNLNNYHLVYTCTIIIKVCIVYKQEHNLLIIYTDLVAFIFHLQSFLYHYYSDYVLWKLNVISYLIV